MTVKVIACDSHFIFRKLFKQTMSGCHVSPFIFSLPVVQVATRAAAESSHFKLICTNYLLLTKSNKVFAATFEEFCLCIWIKTKSFKEM